MIAFREKFDFVGAFRDSPITGLDWGAFFNLPPSIKRDICYQSIQERRCNKGKGKGKGKMVTIEEVLDEQEVSAVVTDQNLGELINFYPKGIVNKENGGFGIMRILVDAPSVVNLVPIQLHQFIRAKLRKAADILIQLP